MNAEGKFKEKYRELNDGQEQAVCAIDGPVMVLAGPGTGKTQILSMRVANILRKTDMNPENILCLTFTDAASKNMTERMAKLFGAAAYDVAVHTFHSFSVNAMGKYSDYFYRGAEYQTADELTKFEIINDILRDLPHDNPLSGTVDGTAIHLSAVQKAISTVKRRGGYNPARLQAICESNLEFIDFAEKILKKTFAGKISIKDLGLYQKKYAEMAKYQDEESTLAIKTINDFADAINDAISTNKTNSITAFKNQYFNTKNAKMKDRNKSEKTLALTKVYEDYQTELDVRKLYDFDDMIVEIIDKLTGNAEFRAELQEQYQYILVDEFQDTNDAQMQILHSLADAPDSNIMVVGDDDQAIYSFQGANVSNLVDFKKFYPDTKVIQLYENYRSHSGVLRLASDVLANSGTRIKSGFFEQVHELLAKKERGDGTKIEFIRANNEIDEMTWVAESAAKEVASDEEKEVAIITREHKDLVTLIPYLHRAGVHNIDYEKSSNVLESEPIRALEVLARTVCHIANGAHAKANELLPQVLAHNAWEIPATEIWKFSIQIKDRGNWLKQMQDNESFAEIAQWLIEMSKFIQNESAEDAIDELFNKAYKQYYFNDTTLNENPNLYLEYLTDLITLRGKVRDYKTEKPTLKTFIEVIDLYKKYGQEILANREFGEKSRIHLMSAHKAKGLEFDTVFMLRGTRGKWLKKSSDKFFPSNLPLTLPLDLDENLRLIFVAITRARQQLFITAPDKIGKNGDDLTILPVLGDIPIVKVSTDAESAAKLETAWNAKFVKVSNDLKSLLAPTLGKYKLNATAVNSFTNLEYAGPDAFLLNKLLRFPQPKSASADYGTAVHETMKYAHQYFAKNEKKPDSAEIIRIFENQLKLMHMSDKDYNYYLGKGSDNLTKFIGQHEFNARQQVEQTFDARIGGMTLTGKLDLIEIDEKTKTISVYDYKTGGSFDAFNKGKIKTHTYHQQLMFYKLLIENSNNRPGYKVNRGVLYFVEANDDEPKSIEIDYSDNDIAKFTELLTSIWDRIMQLDFPDVTDYPKNLKGTLEFEDFLRECNEE